MRRSNSKGMFDRLGKGVVLTSAALLGLGALVGVAPAAHAATCDSVPDRNAYDGPWKGGENNTLVGGFAGLLNFVETKYTRADGAQAVYLGQFVLNAHNVLTNWTGTQLIGDGSTLNATISSLVCEPNGRPISFVADVVSTGTDKKTKDMGTFTLKRVSLGSSGS